MARFLRLPENREVMRKLEFISSNNFKQAALLDYNQKKIFDVLSFESNSYFGKRGVLKSKVGDGKGPMPVLDAAQPTWHLRRRFYCKRRVNENDILQGRPKAKKRRVVANCGASVGVLTVDSDTRTLDDHQGVAVKNLWVGSRRPGEKAKKCKSSKKQRKVTRRSVKRRPSATPAVAIRKR